MLETIFTIYLAVGAFYAMLILVSGLLGRESSRVVKDPYFYIFVLLTVCPFVNLVMLGMFIGDRLK